MTNYTTLTDAELSAMVAERVLGWKICDRERIGWGPGPTVWWTNEEDSPTWEEENILTWTGIGLIVEAMRGKGWYVRIDGPFVEGENYWAGFSPQGVTGWNGRPDYREQHEQAPRAVAVAALRALEGR